MRDTLLNGFAIILITVLLTMFGISQADKSPTVHPPTSTSVDTTK